MTATRQACRWYIVGERTDKIHPRKFNRFPPDAPAPNTDRSTFQLRVDDYIIWDGSETIAIRRIDKQAKLNAANTGTYPLNTKAYVEKSRDQYGIDNWNTITAENHEEQFNSRGNLPLNGEYSDLLRTIAPKRRNYLHELISARLRYSTRLERSITLITHSNIWTSRRL